MAGKAAPTTSSAAPAAASATASKAASSAAPSESEPAPEESVPQQFRKAAGGNGAKVPTLKEQWEMTNSQVNTLLSPLLRRSERFRQLHEHFWGMTGLMMFLHLFFTILVYQMEKRDILTFPGFQRNAERIWKTFGESLDLKSRRYDVDIRVPILGIFIPKQFASDVSMSHGIALKFFGLFYILPIYIFYPRVAMRWRQRGMKTQKVRHDPKGSVAALMDKKGRI